MDMLIFVEGPQKGQRYPIEAPRLTLGRDRKNDIPLDDSGSSRTHAVLLRTDETLLLRDQGSTNGTFLNAKRVTEAPLRNGDQITIGDTVILVESTRSVSQPRVVVSDVQHDQSADVTVEMDSTVFLSTGALVEAHAEAQQQVLSLFNYINRISGALEMEKLLPLALHEMVRVLQADRGAVLFLNKADELVPQVTYPEDSTDVVISRTITDTVLNARQGVLSNPGSDTGQLRDTVSISKRDVGSVLCVPLMSEDRVFGVIYVDRRTANRRFSTRSLHMMSAMAMQLAIGVQNARLYRSLRNSEEFASCILKSMVAGLLVVDERGIVIRANDAAHRILGLEQRELGGLTLAGDGRFRELSSMVEQTKNTGIPLDRGEVSIRVGETEIPLGVSTSLLEDYAGQSIGVLCAFRDLTRLKKLSEEVKRSRHLAALGEMAAGIAHEVRNPLNSVYGFAQLLEESAKKREESTEEEYAQIILEEVSRINQIVQDMLDFSRQREFTMSLLDLEQLVGNLVKQLEVDLVTENLELVFHVDAESKPKVMGSADKLKQLFMNIIRNACQACSEGGHVDVGIEVGRNPADVYSEAVVRIRDDGAGIPQEAVEKIFNPFFTTKDVGTGLGLPICQKIAESHAGRIEVESSPGFGSTFSVYLPMREE